MKHTTKLILVAMLITSMLSCRREGCTDCNASNFNDKAKKDDNSCEFLNEELLGVYSVQDSITGPPTMEWYYDAYTIEVVRADCEPNHLKISNYANKNNAFSGVNFDVECQISNDAITIFQQAVNGDIVRSGSGYFSNDSIRFDIEYENEFGEVFFGSCFGTKE